MSNDNHKHTKKSNVKAYRRGRESFGNTLYDLFIDYETVVRSS